ncbi:hypothetical protein Nepgr_027636 [Nepenthes gracilis]|uniref:VAN3-binding protein-like auxin canalisation domain-containing protein n=1 Tax=Nepenthes gracilis TaxID=150966 RepID=A0AAD3TAW1_NEPGR|nr:hypothetical protein Nepgr_027636 [Nepenthes gracilis]
MQFLTSDTTPRPLLPGSRAGNKNGCGTGSKTVGRWLKERRERKKEETRAQNAQLHAAISVAAVAAALAATAAATAATSGSGKDEQAAMTDMAMATAATLVAARCVEAAEGMGAERDQLASVISSAVNVQSHGDIMTLTAAAATEVLVRIGSQSETFKREEMGGIPSNLAGKLPKGNLAKDKSLAPERSADPLLAFPKQLLSLHNRLRDVPWPSIDLINFPSDLASSSLEMISNIGTPPTSCYQHL